jgi:hypothetical protein
LGASGQVAASDLPDWTAVTQALTDLLADFLAEH